MMKYQVGTKLNDWQQIVDKKSDIIPDWIRNTANWWITDQISETSFLNAIEFLVKAGIIIIEIVEDEIEIEDVAEQAIHLREVNHSERGQDMDTIQHASTRWRMIFALCTEAAWQNTVAGNKYLKT